MMLVIREPQLAVLQQMVSQESERRLASCLRDAFEHPLASFDDSEMAALVRLAVERASCHGHRGLRSVFLYATLMVMLGAFFDEDPRFDWLTELMRDRTQLSPAARLDDAHDAVMRYLDDIAGRENQHLTRALLRIHDTDLAALGGAAAAATTEDADSALGTALSRLFPERARRDGEAAMRSVAARGRDLASLHGMATGPGVALFAVLVFMLGWRFSEDPQFPWARVLLAPRVEQATAEDADEAVAALYGRAIEFLRHGLRAEAS
jgi:hypothetical protein